MTDRELKELRDRAVKEFHESQQKCRVSNINLVGRKIVALRQMTKRELAREGWDGQAIAIILDDGTVLFPSQDEEGNGPGAIFGTDSKGAGFGLGL